MTIKYITAAIVALGCISAAEAPSNYSVYAGPPVTSDPVILDVFDRAVAKCSVEASIPLRGTPEYGSSYHTTALRACLSRHGFIDNGAYAFPTNSPF